MSTLSETANFRNQPAVAMLGVAFDNVTTAETVALVERMVASRRPHYFVTANVDFLAQARTDVELRRILLDAHLVLCDGTPLVWASRLLGNPLPERVAGSDLVPLLIGMAAEKNLRLFFLGGTPESMERAIAKLKAEHPRLAVGWHSPPFDQLLEMDHEDIKRRIAVARPDLLFVSFGCPKQEKWIAMHYQSLGVPVAAGVGGTIDFLAGQLKRAPRWMQRTGTEWLFRLGQEPRRLFGRYVRDLRVFGGAMLAQWWRMQFRHPSGRVRAPVKPPKTAVFSYAAAGWHWVELPERLDFATVRWLNVNFKWDEWEEAETSNIEGRLPAAALLQMKRVEFIDSTGMGWLIRLQREFHAAGRQLILLEPHPAVTRALSLMRLGDFFACAPDLAAARELIENRRLEERELVRANAGRSPVALGWRGEITAANAEPVWQQTEKRLAAKDAAWPWVIDLSQVRFIDSTGLGIMMRARKFAQRRGCELSFAGAQPAVRNVLRLARLEAALLGDAA